MVEEIEKRIRRLQKEFQQLNAELRKTYNPLKDLDKYMILFSLLEEIVLLKQGRARERKLNNILSMDLADHAESIVKGVNSGFTRLPPPKKVPLGLIKGTCYQGESCYYYEDFTPVNLGDVQSELKSYVERGFEIPSIWIFLLNYQGERTGFLIDGHG
ncbi:MAG: hypothetical protein QXO27_01485, partial [Candidatus Aenigmatarchaeota archaeon]